MSEMNIASCLNEAYVPYTYVMLKSLFESNKNNDITVYLLHDGLTEKSTRNLFNLTKSYGQKIEIMGVTNFSMDKRIYEYGGWNELTMYRLLLWDILPAKVDRVLHLDGDMIINKDLSELYNMDFDGKDLIACPDVLAAGARKNFCIQTHGKEFKGLFEEGKYFNAGMMVMNVAKNRGKNLMDTYEKTGQELEYVLPYPDQDLLNITHEDQVVYVDTLTYNFPAYDGRFENGGYDEDRVKNEVAIVHFLDKKPWSEGSHKFYDIENLWWKMCEGSPYEEQFRKDHLICVLGLDENSDANKTIAQAEKIYKQCFRGVRFVFVDTCGVGKDSVKGSKNVEYFDVSQKDFPSVGALKNYVARKLSFGDVMFLVAGVEVEEPIFYEVTDAAAKELVLWEEGTGVIDRAFYGKTVFEDLGGFVEELVSDEDYELALRILAYGYGDDMLFWQEKSRRGIFESTYDMYAYAIGEFSGLLKEKSLFDSVITRRVEEAKAFQIEEHFATAMEEAMKRKDFKRPILILTGQSECQGALDSFAQNFGAQLRRHGQGVIFSNGNPENLDRLRKYLLSPLKAVVGFQTKMYGTKLSSGEYLGNVIMAPKFNFLFDHPIYMTEELVKDIQDVYILSQDETYVEYIKGHIPQVKAAYHFPPAGLECTKKQDKLYDISFVGTYNDYRLQEDMMYTLPQNYRDLSKRFYRRQLEEPNKRAEEILDEIFDAMGYEVDEDEYVKTLFAMGYAVKAAMYRFREKIVESLLEGGVIVDVFSESWEKAPFAKHENLRIHDEVPFEQSMEIMAKSKLSLNVMSWHKGGMTERLSNAMLNKSVCVTDETTYIKREYPENMLLFKLEDYSDLPKRVKELLADDAKREAMAEAAYKKAKKFQTWSARSKEFIKIIDKIQKETR